MRSQLYRLLWVLIALAVLAVPLTFSRSSIAAPVDAINGPAWSGSIAVDSVEVFDVPEFRFEVRATGVFRDLVRLDSESGTDSFYQAYVNLGFNHERYGLCDSTSEFQLLETSTMTYAGPSTATVDSFDDDDIQFVPVAFELWDTADGTYFYPYRAIFNAPTTYTCGDSVPEVRSGHDALSYQYGYAPAPESPLVDTDPDPDRLVGTTVYTLATIPGGPVWNYSAYSYTISYDLTRGSSGVLDTDGDGVVDTFDQCPGTPAGTPANAAGCPLTLDADSDGIADNIDQCPGTPAGIPVDSTGCPTNVDTDGDGVIDSWEVFFGSDPNNPADNLNGRPKHGGPPAQGAAAVTCGQAAFEWHTSVGGTLGGDKGDKACLLVLSNAATQALLDVVLYGDVENLSAGVVQLLTGTAVGDSLPTPTEAFRSIEGSLRNYAVRRQVFKSLGLIRFNSIFTAGYFIGYAGVPTLAALIINEIRNHNACLQIRLLETDTGTVVDWNMLFSEGRTTDKLDHKSGVYEKRQRRFALDEYVERPSNLSCGSDGLVRSSGSVGKPFDPKQPVMTNAF